MTTPPLDLLLATFEDCDPACLDSEGEIRALLERAAVRARLTLLQVVSTKFQPQGVTGVALVGESHLAVHTWPEQGRLFFEVVSCAGRASAERALAVVAESLPGARLAVLDQMTHGYAVPAS